MRLRVLSRAMDALGRRFRSVELHVVMVHEGIDWACIWARDQPRVLVDGLAMSSDDLLPEEVTEWSPVVSGLHSVEVCWWFTARPFVLSQRERVAVAEERIRLGRSLGPSDLRELLEVLRGVHGDA